jgi:hypothetical protein
VTRDYADRSDASDEGMLAGLLAEARLVTLLVERALWSHEFAKLLRHMQALAERADVVVLDAYRRAYRQIASIRDAAFA